METEALTTAVSNTAQNITLGIAIWGAALASITFGWNLFRDLSDRGKLRVSCYVGTVLDQNTGIDIEDVLVWHVTNVGHRPVFLTHVGGIMKDKTSFLLKVHDLTPLPKMLQPGEYYLDYLEDYSNFDFENLKKLYAHDSRSKYYYPTSKQFKATKEKLIKLFTEDTKVGS